MTGDDTTTPAEDFNATLRDQRVNPRTKQVAQRLGLQPPDEPDDDDTDRQDDDT